MDPLPLYETPEIRAAVGPGLRPGGLELTRRALDLCGFPPGSRVLDVGSGPGITLSVLTGEYGLRASGLDPSWRMIGQSRSQVPAASLASGKAEALPFANASFDGLLSECVLSLTADPDAALTEYGRVLKPGGRLILTDLYSRGNDPARAAGLPMACCINGARPEDAVRESVHAAGFHVDLWEDHSTMLKQLAARLVFEHGSMGAFWEAVGLRGCGPETDRRVRALRPGYFLLLARKGTAP